MPVTSGGIPYKMLFGGYREQFATNANQIVAWLKCDWADAAEFKAEIVGYTTWAGGATTSLARVTPLLCPYTDTLYCQTADLVKKGVLPDRESMADPTLGGWLECDWCVYECSFQRFTYDVKEDTEIGLGAGAEMNRYLTVSRRYAPKERRRPGYVFETVEATPQAIDETGFIPDYEIEYLLTWHQIPEAAVPDAAIAASMNTVNDLTFTIRGKARAAGTLLFKGPSQPVMPYAGADGSLYVDLTYVMAYRPNGFNKFRKNDGSYVPLRVKGSASGLGLGIPPYPASRFDNLFTPGDS